MVIVDAIAHAVDPPLLFSHHQHVEELEVIVVEIHGYLSDLVVQDKVHEVDQKVQEALDEKEHQDHHRRKNLAVMEIWSHLFFRSQE